METRTVHLYVLEGLADWEPGYAIAGINTPEFQKQPGRYRVVSVGKTRDPIKTAGGLTIVPDITLEQLEPQRSAMLILPGSDAWLTAGQPAVVAKVSQLRAAKVPVAAICGATAALAGAGLLDRVAHTSNARQFLEMQPNYRGAEHYREQAAVDDDGLITAGGTAALAFARAIFERLDLYRGPVLDAWYGLYSTGEARYFHQLIEAGQPS
jgi:putative intracellular protease/amidase